MLLHQKSKKSYVFKYDDLLDFEVLEDDTFVTKGGFVRAAFGLAGAIAVDTTKQTKQVCNKLQVKVTTRNIDRPIVYIELINTELKKDGVTYKQAFKSVQNILSKFQLVIEQIGRENNEKQGLVVRAFLQLMK